MSVPISSPVSFMYMLCCHSIVFFPLLQNRTLRFPPSLPLCSARGRAIGSDIATPEVQANVLHLRILNRCQGKVPLGCPGNHASRHALCEWQEEGVTDWELCVNGHLGQALKPLQPTSGTYTPRFIPHIFQNSENNTSIIIIINIIIIILCFHFFNLLGSIQMERLKDVP